MFGLGTTIANLFNSIVGIFAKKIPDATTVNIDQTAENIAQTTAQANAITAAAKNVYGEITGESWLQRNWRPLLMAELMAILFNNSFGVAYFHGKYILMTTDMWDLLKIGLGGYMLGRSGEKIVKVIKG